MSAILLPSTSSPSYNVGPSGDTTGATDYSRINTITNSAGSVARLAPGTYYINSPINLATNAAIIGSGVNTAINVASGFSGTAALTITSSAVGVYFEDFVLNGNKVGAAHGIYLNNTGLGADSRHRISNVQVLNTGNDGIYLGPACIETVVEGTYVLNSGRYGYNTDVAATDNKFIGCTTGASASQAFFIQGNTTHYIGCKAFYAGYNGSSFTAGGCGFYLGPAANQQLRLVVMSNCETQNCGGDGFHVDGSASGADVEYCTFVNCTADGNNEMNQTYNGFSVLHTVNSTFTNCVVHNQASGANPGNHNFGLALFDACTNTTFNNCYFPAGQGGSVYLDGSLSGNYKLNNCNPYNPVGKIGSPPAVAASGTAVTNNTGVDAMVLVTLNASVATSISVGGNATGISSSTSGTVLSPVFVPVGQTITLTYSSTAPSWVWFGS